MQPSAGMLHLAQFIATLSCTIFAGAAVYINLVEHPARMSSSEGQLMSHSMKSTIVNLHDAKTQLSEPVARAEKGERITLARAGKAVAQLGPIARPKRKRSVVADPLLQVDDYSYDGPVCDF